MMKDLYEKILNAVMNADDDKKIEMWNEYAAEVGEHEIMYVDNINFDELFTDANDAVRAVYYGDFNFGDEYAAFNGYENLVSFPFVDSKYSPFCADDVANWLYSEGNYNDYFDDLDEIE